jgi:hypothetical protein
VVGKIVEFDIEREKPTGDMEGYSGLPDLSAQEIRKLVTPFLLWVLQDEARIEFGFVLWKDQEDVDLHYGGASFELGFRTNHCAYYVAKLAAFYFVRDESVNRYTIKTRRRPGSISDPADEADEDIGPQESLAPETVAAKEPAAKRRRGKGKFLRNAGGSSDDWYRLVHPAQPEDALQDQDDSSDSDLDSEEDDMVACDQCTLAVDPLLPPEFNIAKGWKHSVAEGYGICQYNKLFCSEACVTKYIYGSRPTPPYGTNVAVSGY